MTMQKLRPGFLIVGDYTADRSNKTFLKHLNILVKYLNIKYKQYKIFKYFIAENIMVICYSIAL